MKCWSEWLAEKAPSHTDHDALVKAGLEHKGSWSERHQDVHSYRHGANRLTVFANSDGAKFYTRNDVTKSSKTHTDVHKAIEHMKKHHDISDGPGIPARKRR